MKSSITVMSVRTTTWRFRDETRRTRWQAAVSVVAIWVRRSEVLMRSVSSSTVRLCFLAMSVKERSGEERSVRRERAEEEAEEDSPRRSLRATEEDGEGEEEEWEEGALTGEQPVSQEGVVAA